MSSSNPNRIDTLSDQPVRLIVASENPVKIRAATGGFERVFPQLRLEAESVSVDSGVRHQPIGDEETFLGAAQRAGNARFLRPEGGYWIGIEGGIDDTPQGMVAFAWIVVLSPSQTGRARTGAFFLPDQVAELVRQGMELGDADDLVFGRSNSKQNEGAIGLLTDGAMDRRELYEHAVVLALVSLKNPDRSSPAPA